MEIIHLGKCFVTLTFQWIRHIYGIHICPGGGVRHLCVMRKYEHVSVCTKNRTYFNHFTYTISRAKKKINVIPFPFRAPFYSHVLNWLRICVPFSFSRTLSSPHFSAWNMCHANIHITQAHLFLASDFYLDTHFPSSHPFDVCLFAFFA